MPYTARSTQIFEIRENTAFAAAGMTTTYRVAEMRVTGADRHNAQAFLLSANLSAEQIQLNPFGVSAPLSMLWLLADHDVDVRFGAVDASIVSAVRHMALGAQVSSLFVTTGPNVTAMLLEAVGGSGATITATVPLA